MPWWTRPPRSAEVAFAVADAHQGRGIGTVLLDHPVRIARAAGIIEFQAEVLGENNRMLEVFGASGFVVTRSTDAGVVHVTFPTEETERAQAAALADETRGTAPFAGELLAAEDHDILTDFGPSFIGTHETLLRARQQGGRIREGHGDLHAEHVCFVDTPVPAGADSLPAGIYVFDCIEFSVAFRCNDVASEVAFLAMDLESLRHPELARRFVAAYVDAAADPAVPVLLPFYACYLAGVRGKVEGIESREPEVDPADREAAAARAREHFALAVRYAWEAGGPALIACGGLSGTGKSDSPPWQRAGAVLSSSSSARRTRRPCARGWEARDDTSSPSAHWDTYLGQRRQREPFGAGEPHIVVDTSGSLATARAAAMCRLWHWRQGRMPG